MRFGKATDLCLAKTELLHDLKAGVIGFRLPTSLFLVVLGYGILNVLFPKACRSPGMNGIKLIAIANLIESTIFDSELAQHFCHRVVGIVRNSFRGFLTRSGSLATFCFLVDSPCLSLCK